MRIDILTVLPEMIDGAINCSILKRAQDKGLVEFGLHNLRDYGIGKHRRVDDYPFGGKQVWLCRLNQLIMQLLI